MSWANFILFRQVFLVSSGVSFRLFHSSSYLCVLNFSSFGSSISPCDANTNSLSYLLVSSSEVSLFIRGIMQVASVWNSSAPSPISLMNYDIPFWSCIFPSFDQFQLPVCVFFSLLLFFFFFFFFASVSWGKKGVCFFTALRSYLSMLILFCSLSWPSWLVFVFPFLSRSCLLIVLTFLPSYTNFILMACPFSDRFGLGMWIASMVFFFFFG